jgi:hypothetical protein
MVLPVAIRAIRLARRPYVALSADGHRRSVSVFTYPQASVVEPEGHAERVAGWLRLAVQDVNVTR